MKNFLRTSVPGTLIVAAVLAIVVALSLYGGSTSATPRPRTKTLTDAAATGFVDISIPASGSYTAGRVRWRIDATDTTDYQSRTGFTYFVAVNKAGTVTCSVGDIGTTVVAVSSGTLTNTMTCTAGTGKLTLNANADSSLTAPTVRINYYIEMIGASTPSGL
jgi:hypothetical protein